MFINRMIPNTDNRYLLQFHTECILNCGLILDEDMEILLNNYPLLDSKTEIRLIHPIFAASFLSNLAIGSLAVYWKSTYLISIFAICLTPTVFIMGSTLNRWFYLRNHKNNINNLMQYLKKFVKFGNDLIIYLKQRKCFIENDENFIEPYSEHIKNLMDFILKSDLFILNLLLSNLKKFCQYSCKLNDTYLYLQNLNLQEFATDNINTLDNCIETTTKLQDIKLLVTSNFLTTLAISLSNEELLIFILNNTIPTIVSNLRQHNKNSQTCLDNAKYYTVKQQQIQPQNKKSNFINTKLNDYINSNVTKMFLLLEKSQLILENLKQSRVQPEKLYEELKKLRNETLDYHNSLDILCQLYESSIIGTPKQPQIAKKQEITDGRFEELAKIEEETDCEQSDDEEYEMYTGQYDDDLETRYDVYPEEESGIAFMSLMTKELQQALKLHQKFLAAREKRGIKDEDQCLVQKTKEIVMKNEESTAISVVDCSLPPPMPPPPPQLPGFGLDFQDTSHGLLDSIKLISSQRKIVEEVFGDEEGDNKK